MLGQYDNARMQVMPSAGVAYAADANSPILREALRSNERVVYTRPQAAPARVHAQTPKPAPVRRDYSLAELEKKPVADLRLMLAERNVAQGNATEKDELAAWVHQHQHLPVVRPDASVGKTPSATVRASQGPRSMNELKQMSVADLHEILDQRGVGPGSATEKSELVRWVFQHQDLPVIHTGKQRHRRARWGYGPGRPHDSPRDRRRKKESGPEMLEGDDPKLLEDNSDQRLLEGLTDAKARKRHWWFLLCAGLGLSFVSLVVFVAVNDAKRGTVQLPVEPEIDDDETSS